MKNYGIIEINSLLEKSLRKLSFEGFSKSTTNL